MVGYTFRTRAGIRRNCEIRKHHPQQLVFKNSITTQVLPPTSFAVRLEEFAETRHVFGTLGLAGMAIMFSVGLYSWFSPPEAMRLADLLSAFGEAFMVSSNGRLHAHVACYLQHMSCSVPSLFVKSRFCACTARQGG